MAILDWSIGPTYILKLLGCQFEQKPSIQALVRSVTNDFIVRLAEPSVRSPCISYPLPFVLLMQPWTDDQAKHQLAGQPRCR